MIFLGAFSASAATITLAGSVYGIGGDNNDEVDQWRTTSVAKSFDPDGDNVYGSMGYVLYAADAATNGNAGAVTTTNPLTYNVSATRRTFSSIPSFLTLASTGQTGIASSYGYRLIDDPTLTPGTSVADLESGAALRQSVSLGVETAMMTLTLSAGVPAQGFRVGFLVDNTDPFGGTIRLAQTTGGTSSVTAAQNVAPLGFVFFDIVGGVPGDVFTLNLMKSNPQPGGGNTSNNVIYGGMTFDAIPEPGSALLIGLAGGVLALRRRRQESC